MHWKPVLAYATYNISKDSQYKIIPFGSLRKTVNMKYFTFAVVCIAILILVTENQCFPQQFEVSTYQVRVDEVTETQDYQGTEDEVLESVFNGDCPEDKVRVGEVCTAEQ